MLSGTGDVRHDFMCSERLKNEVGQLLKLNFYTPCQLVCSVAQIQVIIFDFPITA